MHRPGAALGLLGLAAVVALHFWYTAKSGVFYGKGGWFSRDEYPWIFRAALWMEAALMILACVAAIAVALGMDANFRFPT